MNLYTKLYDEILYVLTWPDNSFVGIDETSGGYPYAPTGLNGVKFWTERELNDLERYKKMFPDLRGPFEFHWSMKPYSK